MPSTHIENGRIRLAAHQNDDGTNGDSDCLELKLVTSSKNNPPVVSSAETIRDKQDFDFIILASAAQPRVDLAESSGFPLDQVCNLI
jgi:hypothetical protein